MHETALRDLIDVAVSTGVYIMGLSVWALTVTVSSVNPNTQRTAYENSSFLECYASSTGKQFSCTALPCRWRSYVIGNVRNCSPIDTA